jgi:6-phosphofructokinase 1
MNACVRAIVQTAAPLGIEVVGIKRGYQGLLEEDFFINTAGKPRLTARRVNGWLTLGGAGLRSSRCDEFLSEGGQIKGAKVLERHKIDAIIPIGGDGTFRGSIALANHWNGQIIGCPGTIDNDLIGTDYTIGFSTAVQTAVDAVDKIRDTADSHDRMFLIEVMGRHSGYIAAYTAIAGGADFCAIPETATEFNSLIPSLCRLKSRGKNSIIMVVSEGDEEGGAEIIRKKLVELGCPYSTRIVILGHLQRGGSPTHEDRRRATQMGAAAVHAIVRGETGKMVGTMNDLCQCVSFEQTIASHREIPDAILQLLNFDADDKIAGL